MLADIEKWIEKVGPSDWLAAARGDMLLLQDPPYHSLGQYQPTVIIYLLKLEGVNK